MSISIADVDDRARHEKPADPQPAVRMLSASTAAPLRDRSRLT